MVRLFRRKRKRPSFEDGELRDPSIKAMQDQEYRADNLKDAIRKSVKRPKTS